MSLVVGDTQAYGAHRGCGQKRLVVGALAYGQFMDSTWETRDLAVLRVAVEHFDDPAALRLSLESVAAQAGLSDNDVKRAARALHEASPPYVEGITVDQASYPIALTGVTERARRAVGQWPTPEALAERIISALTEAAEKEQDPDKKGRLSHAADVGKGVLTGVLTNVLTQGM